MQVPCSASATGIMGFRARPGTHRNPFNDCAGCNKEPTISNKIQLGRERERESEREREREAWETKTYYRGKRLCQVEQEQLHGYRELICAASYTGKKSREKEDLDEYVEGLNLE